MCGRYNIDFEEEKEIREIITQVDQKLHSSNRYDGMTLKSGDIYPTNYAPILLGEGKKREAEIASFGFPNFKNKGVIINARSETVETKPMFRNSLISRRCIIPSTGFYEWDQRKRKYYIHKPDTKVLYMAGIYNYFEEEDRRFVILTTKANESMEVIHERMPVILQKEQLDAWLFDESYAKEALRETMPALSLELADQSYEQISLFDL